MDTRINLIAKIIVNHSLKICDGDRVLIKYKNSASNPLLKELIKEISEVGGMSFLKMQDIELDTLLRERYSDKSIKELVKLKKFETENYDCYISVGYNLNDYEFHMIML